jgi:FKBP-type peptidyl-prolyl cis-trans isomerase
MDNHLHRPVRILLLLALLSFSLGIPCLGLAEQQPAQTPATVPPPPDVAAPPADAEKTSSGLASKLIEPGSGGEHPGPSDQVTVHYTGWTADGRMFDSTSARGRPSTFALNRVLPGWTEGVQLMVKGEKRRFWLPERLTFAGAAGKPRGVLCFDIELIDFIPAPKAPPDVAKPPADAERTRSGIHSKVIQPGNGTVHPSKNSTVIVHYTGWTTDGQMFDSSVTAGRPATFPLDQVIAGWTEGVQLMVEGEKRRFWIPEKLAYRGEAGRPKGMLVFDIELLEIEK